MDTRDSNMCVFDAICDMMTDSDFITANQEFMARHCDSFDANVEENKHEYKDIFEDFLR